MKPKYFAAIAIIGLITVASFSGIDSADATVVPDDLNTGPYVDKIVYRVITNPDLRILSLEAGQIEMDTSFNDPIHYADLDANPDISIYGALRNGYGHIVINCDKYPLNMSAFRRAFAFAFDKYRVTAEVMDGYNQEHDSLVPYANSFCIEDEMPYHYYSQHAEIGNQLLDDAGFGWNGTPYAEGSFRTEPVANATFHVDIEYGAHSEDIAGATARIGVDALRSLGVDAYAVASDFNEIRTRLYNHEDYDMVFYSTNFNNYDVDWLAYEYWSEFANTTFQNPSNFANETYDYWRGQLLNGTTYSEVYEAAAEMQLILHYQVPRLVVFQKVDTQSYRNDKYTGHVADLGQYIAGPWTMRKIHKIDGTQGGTVPVAIAGDPDSFNFYTSTSANSSHILSNLHTSLYKYGPDLAPHGDLAEALLVETHADNVAIQDGHRRYTIDIIQNATWSDGVPLTAEDVAFTFEYTVESGAYGNPAGDDLSTLLAVYAPTPYRVVLEFGIESYWQFSDFAYDYIIPKHIFNNTGGIGYAGWDTWNPVFDSAQPHVTCGPFILTDYVAGEFYEISANPDYHWYPDEPLNPAPEISSPGWIEYEEDTEGHEIEWIVSDDDPLLYMVFKDNIAIVSDTWAGENIIVDIDGLSEGFYNYTLILMDNSLNVVGDTVWVNVTASTITTSTTTSTSTTTTPTSTILDTTIPTTGLGDGILGTISLVVSIGSVVIILVVVVLICKQKEV